MKPKPDIDHSLERLLLSEEHRTRTTGFGTTRQGQALARQYRKQLADKIAADRTYGRQRHKKDVWRALKGMDDEVLAIRLLVAGVSVSEDGKLGTDDDGQKNVRDQARFIGRNLGQQRELGFLVGVWGINMLLSVPVFALDGDLLRMTESADVLMDDVLVNGVRNNPFLSPLTTPPEHGHRSAKAAYPPIIGRRKGCQRRLVCPSLMTITRPT